MFSILVTIIVRAIGSNVIYPASDVVRPKLSALPDNGADSYIRLSNWQASLSISFLFERKKKREKQFTTMSRLSFVLLIRVQQLAQSEVSFRVREDLGVSPIWMMLLTARLYGMGQRIHLGVFLSQSNSKG